MTLLGANNLTIADVAKLVNPDGSAVRVAELLNQSNRVMEDIPWIEGNMDDGHQTSMRTSLPSSGTRKANQGVSPTSSSVANATEVTTIFEDWVRLDEVVAKKGPGIEANRFIEAVAHAEAMTQNFVQMLFFGNNATTPTDFTGFAPRYNSLSGVNAENIIDAGGTGSDNTSVWLVGWSSTTVSGIFPKGATAGINHKDWGLAITQDATGPAGAVLAMWTDQWQWFAGLAVHDWRFVVRIANIDVSDLISSAAGAADLSELMIAAIERIPNPDNVALTFYVNRTVRQMFRIQQRNDVIAGGGLTFENIGGKRILMFNEAQVKVVDRLTLTEAQVT